MAKTKDLKNNSVEQTLRIPLWCRAIAAKKLPHLLPDHDAAEILRQMGETKPPTVFYNMQCAALAGAMRQYDFASEINEYLKLHQKAVIVEMGAGLSCLRRQMKNESNIWINLDLPDVIAAREKYIPCGAKEQNMACDLTDHSWMLQLPFDAEQGIIFLAAGVLHYFEYEQVSSLMAGMAEAFPGGRFIFDYPSKSELKDGNGQVKNTGNATRMAFYLDAPEKQIRSFSTGISGVEIKSYLEGYETPKIRYSLITKLYIKSKRDKLFVAKVDF